MRNDVFFVKRTISLCSQEEAELSHLKRDNMRVGLPDFASCYATGSLCELCFKVDSRVWF